MAALREGAGRWGTPGKLTDAARHWAALSRRADPAADPADASAAELAALGFSPRQAAQWREQETQQADEAAARDCFEVWPENRDTLLLWLEIAATQWRVGALGGLLGLDHLAIDVLLRRTGREVTAQQYEDLLAMERAALPVLNRQVAGTG